MKVQDKQKGPSTLPKKKKPGWLRAWLPLSKSNYKVIVVVAVVADDFVIVAVNLIVVIVELVADAIVIVLCIVIFVFVFAIVTVVICFLIDIVFFCLCFYF